MGKKKKKASGNSATASAVAADNAADAAADTATHTNVDTLNLESINLSSPVQSQPSSASPVQPKSQSQPQSSSASPASSSSPALIVPVSLNRTSFSHYRIAVIGFVDSLLKQVRSLRAHVDTPIALSDAVSVDSSQLQEQGVRLSQCITQFFSLNVSCAPNARIDVMRSAAHDLETYLTGVCCLLRAMLYDTNSSSSSRVTTSNRSSATATTTAKATLARFGAIVTASTDVLTHVETLLVTLRDNLAVGQLAQVDDTRTEQRLQRRLSVAHIPLTNAMSIGMFIHANLTMIVEGAEEMEAQYKDGLSICDESSSGKGVRAHAGATLTRKNDWSFQLAEKHHRLLPTVAHLCTVASNIVKSVYAYVLSAKLDESVSSNIDFLQRLASLVLSIRTRLDDLVTFMHRTAEGKMHITEEMGRLDAAEVVNTFDNMRAKDATAVTHCLLAIASRIVQFNATANAVWPIKDANAASSSSSSSSAAAASATVLPPFVANCSLCSPHFTAAADMCSADDEQHAQRMLWLKRCVMQIHGDHTQTEQAS